MRIIDHVIDEQSLIYLLTIYDKADTESVSIPTIKAYIAEILDQNQTE